MNQRPGFPQICLLLFVSLLLTAPARAERECRVLFLGGGNGAPEDVILFDGVGSQKIGLPTMNLSPVYNVADGPLTLRFLKSPPEDPEKIPKAAPKVKVAESTGDFYLLVNSNPKNKFLPLAMAVVDADLEKFRKGEMLWFNLTTHRVGGKLGSEKLDLKPNSRHISKPAAKEAGDFPVELYFKEKGKDDLWPLCETKWIHNPNGRVVMFVISEAGARVPRLIGFPDFRDEKKAEGGNAQAE